jgi:hypothetical protein
MKEGYFSNMTQGRRKDNPLLWSTGERTIFSRYSLFQKEGYSLDNPLKEE